MAEEDKKPPLKDEKVIGNGSFGVVFQATMADTGEVVAVKKVLQDKRFKVIGRTTRGLEFWRERWKLMWARHATRVCMRRHWRPLFEMIDTGACCADLCAGRMQNRELQIMKQLKHSNVVELKCSFYSKGEKVRSAPTLSNISCISARIDFLPFGSYPAHLP